MTLMFIPTVTSTFTEIVNYSIKKSQGNTDGLSLKSSLFRISRHIPLVQPFVHFSAFLKLKKARDDINKAVTFYKRLPTINDANRLKYKTKVEEEAVKYKEAKEAYTQYVDLMFRWQFCLHTTLLFYQIEPLKNGTSLIFPSCTLGWANKDLGLF